MGVTEEGTSMSDEMFKEGQFTKEKGKRSFLFWDTLGQYEILMGVLYRSL